MKSFKFKYTPMVWVLLAIVLLLSIAGLCWNVFNLVNYLWAGTFKIVTYSLLIALTGALCVLVVSVIIYGRYKIKNGALYTYFGIFHNKTDINEIVEITHFKKSDKLVVYFSDQKYSVIVIDSKEYDEFVLAVRSVNSHVIFDTRIDGEDLPL